MGSVLPRRDSCVAVRGTRRRRRTGEAGSSREGETGEQRTIPADVEVGGGACAGDGPAPSREPVLVDATRSPRCIDRSERPGGDRTRAEDRTGRLHGPLLAATARTLRGEV